MEHRFNDNSIARARALSHSPTLSLSLRIHSLSLSLSGSTHCSRLNGAVCRKLQCQGRRGEGRVFPPFSLDKCLAPAPSLLETNSCSFLIQSASKRRHICANRQCGMATIAYFKIIYCHRWKSCNKNKLLFTVVKCSSSVHKCRSVRQKSTLNRQPAQQTEPSVLGS